MNHSPSALLYLFGTFVLLVTVIGIYCVVVTQNLIRALIGLELLIKAVTLLIVAVGFITGNTGLTQAMVITLIVVEVVIMTVAVGVVIGSHRRSGSLSAKNIANLKG